MCAIIGISELFGALRYHFRAPHPILDLCHLVKLYVLIESDTKARSISNFIVFILSAALHLYNIKYLHGSIFWGG